MSPSAERAPWMPVLTASLAVAILALVTAAIVRPGPAPIPVPEAVASHATTPSDLAPNHVTAVADDFPLLSGWPVDRLEPGRGSGVEGPGSRVELTRTEACGRRVDQPYSERLAARFSNPEDYRERELRTFGSEEQAAAYVASLGALFVDCPREEDDSSARTLQVKRAPALGSDARAIVIAYEDGAGHPVLGLTQLLVARRGTAVVVDRTSGEADGHDNAAVTRATAEATEALEAVIAAMCVYDGESCPTPTTSPRAAPDRD